MKARIFVIGSLTAMMLPLAGGAEAVKRIEDDGTCRHSIYRSPASQAPKCAKPS